jgi:hypothetical protein
MTTVRRSFASLAILALLLALGGCSQPLSTREKGTLVGGGLGAASGAIIGSTVGAPGAGAAIGGAMGALGGAFVGDQLQGQENTAAWQQEQLNQQERELASSAESLSGSGESSAKMSISKNSLDTNGTHLRWEITVSVSPSD